MSQLSWWRVLRMAMAGAVGGLITYLLLNPSIAAQEVQIALGSEVDSTAAMHTVLAMGVILGMAIGAALVAVDEALSGSLQRVVLYTLASVFVGAAGGLAGSIAGQFIFSHMLGGVPLAGPGSITALILARSLGWALAGAGAGLCPGVVSRSTRRVLQGIAGGAVGGGLGGMLFDSLAAITNSGSLSRVVGLVLIGFLIGALVSLVEEFAKEYWVTVLTGSKEGRSFILTRPVISVGRNETTDIPLFGDPGVARLHARLIKQGSAVILAAEPGQVITLNGQSVTQAPLSPGDMIGIASHRLRFGARRASAPAHAPEACPDLTSIVPCPAPAHDTSREPTVPPTGLARLEAISGPHAGAIFSLIPGGLMGRDPHCDIALVNDTQASRQHARLLCDAAGWRIEDAGSTNGTWMNGERISAHPLQSGDHVTIGQTTFMVS